MGARFLDTCRGEVFCFCNKSGGWFVNYGINRNNSPYEKNNPHTVAILICFGVGCTASYFQSDSILNWYPALEKPSCTPPDIAFPIAWSFIYLCMGISIGLIWHIWTIRRQMIIRLFGFQLLFNFTWSIFFFYFRSPLLGFANILVLDVLVIYYMIESYPVRKSSAYLFVPYLLWLLLATYLNGYILMYN